MESWSPRRGDSCRPASRPLLADAVVELLADEATREELGRSARAIAQEKYSWDGIAGRLAEIYASLTGSRSAVAA